MERNGTLGEASGIFAHAVVTDCPFFEGVLYDIVHGVGAEGEAWSI